MRAVVQRVTSASVRVGDRQVGEIGPGLLVLLGIGMNDSLAEADRLVDKLLELRIFSNEQGRFDRSLRDVEGELLVVSQFTLFADTRKGRRPSFSTAAAPELAIPVYERFLSRVRQSGVPVRSGEFGAQMQVELVNDGPVTILLDTEKMG